MQAVLVSAVDVGLKAVLIVVLVGPPGQRFVAAAQL